MTRRRGRPTFDRVPPKINRCHRCGARIAWVRMEHTGNRMPIDPDINDAGNVVARGEIGRGMRGRVVAVGAPIEEYEDRYMTHFATCPYADQDNGGPARPANPLNIPPHDPQRPAAEPTLIDAARTLFDDLGDDT